MGRRDKLYRPDVLEPAWELVKRNKGSYGVDHQSIASIEAAGVEGFLAGIASELREGTYRGVQASPAAGTDGAQDRAGSG